VFYWWLVRDVKNTKRYPPKGGKIGVKLSELLRFCPLKTVDLPTFFKAYYKQQRTHLKG
jgi:hypothetical protein